MKTKTKIKLITILAIVSACALAAGCQVGRETYEQFVDRNGLTCHVTYYSNGGEFETHQTKKEIYYSPDTYAINIGSDDIGDSKIAVHMDGYVLKEWCLPALDGDGNLVYEDEAKTVVKTGEPFDFTKKLTSGTEISLYANWTLDVLIEYRLAGENPITVQEGEETRKVNLGEVITYGTFGRETSVYIKDEAPGGVNSTDSTFLQFFEDEDCEIPFGGTAVKPETPEGGEVKNFVLYAKYMPGKWTVVKDRTQAARMFARMGSGSYYIYNDIDCGGMEVNVAVTNCKIEGNGNVTISNFAVNQTGISANAKNALLGNIGSAASIKDVTFSNIKISYGTRSGLSGPSFVEGLYLFCTGVADGAKFENVKINDVEMSISIPKDEDGNHLVIIKNMLESGGVFETDNWMFGSADESDSAFLAKYSGVSAENCTLSVNGENVASVQ